MSCSKLYGKTKSSPRRVNSPATEVVIMTDRRREAYVPTKLLKAEPARAVSAPAPAADPVAEALQLIKADMTAQALSGTNAAAQSAEKSPVVIRLNGTGRPDTPPAAPQVRRRSWKPPPEPASASIFPDGIEDYCLQVRSGGRGGSVTERFGELLQRQAVVQQLQRRLQLQVDVMRADARREEAAADRERRDRFGFGEEPPEPPVPPTTAADTLLVLREEGGCCGPADLCVTPPDLPRALALIHRLRCEVLELRACSLRATCEKNEVAAKLNHERAQLRRTFTSAQIARLTGGKSRNWWGVEDVRRAIAARRVLTRRQYRYVTDVLRMPLPSLKLRGTALNTGEETRRLYEQLVAEKVTAHMTKKPRAKHPTRSAVASRAMKGGETASRAVKQRLDSLIALASTSSDSEDEQQVNEYGGVFAVTMESD